MKLRALAATALGAFVVVTSACGSDGARPPAARTDCAPVRCTATARHCRLGVAPATGSCVNDDRTEPQRVNVDESGDCFFAALPVDAQAECTARLCASCLPPDCTDCVAQVVPNGGCGFCGGYPGVGAVGVVSPPQTGLPPGTPATFKLRGYSYNQAEISSPIEYEHPLFGEFQPPIDVTTNENIFLLVLPNTLGALSLDTSGTSPEFTARLDGASARTLKTFVITRPTAPGPNTVDAFLGSVFETHWFDVNNGVPNLVRAVGLSGYVTSWSSSPFFAVIDEKSAAMSTVAANEVCLVDYSITSAGNPAQKRCTAVEGAPVGVSSSDNQVWVVTRNPNRALRFFVPSFQLAQQIDLAGSPVAVSGGTLAPALLNAAGAPCTGQPPVPAFHVAITTRTPSGGTQVIGYPGGNLESTGVRVHSFDGEPVTMVTAALQNIEFGWLATRAPNRLVRFVISNPSGPKSTVDLADQVPIRLTIGGTGGVSGAPGDPICFNTEENVARDRTADRVNGMLHVLVRNGP